MYYFGDDGIAKDEAEAVKWLHLSAGQGHADAQAHLGAIFLYYGRQNPAYFQHAIRWLFEAAKQNNVSGQFNLGLAFLQGQGIQKDEAMALSYLTKAAEQGMAEAQMLVAGIYKRGNVAPQNDSEAARWYLKAADQGNADAQAMIGQMFVFGHGVPKDEVSAYKWWLLASAHTNEFEDPKTAASIAKNIGFLERNLTPAQRAEGQRMAREFTPRKATPPDSPVSRESLAESRPESTGSGFFITDDGYLITNQHVADEGAAVRVLTGNGAIPAKVVKVDRANDLALLKVEGKFAPLAITSSRGVRLGSTAATVGFPNVGLQGYSPKLAKGEIASLAGIQDDARHFQISVPVQPGNSGGALVDERGNVIGVVVAKLSQKAAIASTGTLAENVSYAVKSSYLLSFLESVPDVAAKLKEPNTNDRKFEDVIKDAEQAAVLVLVY